MFIAQTNKMEQETIVKHEGTKRAPNFIKEHFRASKRQNDKGISVHKSKCWKHKSRDLELEHSYQT